uniref:Gustatory receptor n=1 Tax=Anopheles farauti TaxID=69004 RepID=A0A182Q325_9DIPT
MACSFAELMQVNLSRANRMGFCYVEYRGPKATGRFVNVESVTVKFLVRIALILASGVYTLSRTKGDMTVRFQRESFFNMGTYFVSNLTIVLLFLHMSWHGYFCREVQLKLLNGVLDIERELVVVFQRRCAYGGVERILKAFTLWSVFFYAVVLNFLFAIDYWKYDAFFAMYSVVLVLLYSNFCMDLAIIVCCTVQMSLCVYLDCMMNVLRSRRNELACLFFYEKHIDRIAGLINCNLSRIYGPFVVLHCSYVLFDCAAMWVSFLEVIFSSHFLSVRQESYWMLANYFLWLVNDAKNVVLMAISSSLLHSKTIWHGFFSRNEQLQLLNGVLDVEQELVLVFKTQCEYGTVGRYIKAFTVWSILFYVVVVHALYVIDIWDYDIFIAIYIETVILLFGNLYIDLTIIVCCTVQMSLCVYLDCLMHVLRSRGTEFACLFFYEKQIDRIAGLINYHLSRIYGPFVVLHCAYVLFDSASMWVSCLDVWTKGTTLDNGLKQDNTLMVVIYLMWLVNDTKNLMLVAFSSSLLQTKLYERMPSLLKRYRLLLTVASSGYLIPCGYNARTGCFECTHRNTFALVCTSLFFGAFVWYDAMMLSRMYNHRSISMVMLGIIAIDITVYNLLIYCIVLNAWYNRKRFVQLLNSLFGEIDWTLEWVVNRVTNRGIHPRSTHSGNLLCLAMLVASYSLYNAMFVDDLRMVLMDTIILARFCFMFLVIELYRACAIVIRDRMKQLHTFFTTAHVDEIGSVEQRMHIFLERYQRYQRLIDGVNQCFAVPLIHSLLIIVLERTVAMFDAYSNFESSVHQSTLVTLLYRQVWETVYLVIMVQMARTSQATIWQFNSDDPPRSTMSGYIDQNRNTFSIVTAIYWLPVSYDPTVKRFVEKRSSFVSFGLGLLMALVYFYHDFFMQTCFFAELSPFSFGVMVCEFFLIAAIPLCIVLNSFTFRKRIANLMNIVFVDDSALDVAGVTLGRTSYHYLHVIFLFLVLFLLFKLWYEDNMLNIILTTTYAIRYALIVQYIYLYHLSVGMIWLRMEQLRILFHQHQHEHDFEQFLRLFVERFKRYVRLIGDINRCFSFPIMVILMLASPVDSMSSKIEHYRWLFHLAAAFYLIPCSYNYRSNRFETSRRNMFAFVLMVTVGGSCLWIDVIAIKASIGNLSMVMLGIVVVYVVTYALLPLTFALNTMYHRERYVRLFNLLFARTEWILQCESFPTARSRGSLAPHHTGNLRVLSVFVVLNCIYNVLYIAEPTILKLYWILLLRFCELFVMLELYRACAYAIKDRMEQLQILLVAVQPNSGTEHVDLIVQIFLERFQRYHKLMDVMNRCFSVPLTHVLLLILLERTVATYDVYDQFYLLSSLSRWEMVGFVFRQTWQLVYFVSMVMVANTATLSSAQNWFTFRLNAAIYLSPCSYDQTVNRFVCNRLNLVAFCVGLLMSVGFIYHDIFIHHFDYSSSFELSIFVVEQGVFGIVPLSTVVNNFVYREQILTLLNVLLVDDSMIELGGGSSVSKLFSITCHRFVKIGNVLIIPAMVYYLLGTGNIVRAVYEFTLLARYFITIQFLGLYHLCVSMVGVRMQQLKELFLLNHNEHDFDMLCNLFLARYERYVSQIERINRCFSVPLLGMVLQAMIELSYFAWEWYTLISSLGIAEKNYATVYHWIMFQFFQAMFTNVLMLAVFSCEEVYTKFLYVYHLCVGMIGLRMQQLRELFLWYQKEHDLGVFLSLFLERFERYVHQIECINRCFSFPLLAMLLQAMLALSYFAYEWFRVMSSLQVVDESYMNVPHWIVSQIYQILYGTVLLLMVFPCEEVHNKFLYVYHLCVGMIGVRMKQIRELFLKNQNEQDFTVTLHLFLERFERYLSQIERINRCFSIPLLVMLLQAVIALSYFVYEWYRVISSLQVVDENYASVKLWIVSQIYQTMYGNVLLLIACSCAKVKDEHVRIFQISTFLYFTPCSYNERLGLFVNTCRNLAVFGAALTLTVPFWVMDIKLMATNYLSTYTKVFATIGGLELMIYVSVSMCAMLNVFVKRKRITKLMNVLFRPDSLLDSCNASPVDETRYDESFTLGAITLIVVVCSSYKFMYHKDLESKILTVMVATRFFACWILIFVHRLHVRAIALRMEQLRLLYTRETDDGHNLRIFFERYDLYFGQIAEVDRCYSLPITLVFLLVAVQLIYLVEEWYSSMTMSYINHTDIVHTIIKDLWQMLYGALGYYTIAACNGASKEVEETALCTRHFDDYRLQNTRAAKQIQKFLLKNLHQKKKFSACGFFDIDNTVIYMVGRKSKVFSSIVTYLVILIQFKQLETDLTQSEGAYNVTNNVTTPGPS